MKTQVSVTLNDHDAELLEQAVKICLGKYWEASATGRQRNHVIRWAIRSVCAAVIREGEWRGMFAVDLRPETEEELAERLGDKIPQSEEATEPKTHPRWLWKN